MSVDQSSVTSSRLAVKKGRSVGFETFDGKVVDDHAAAEETDAETSDVNRPLPGVRPEVLGRASRGRTEIDGDRRDHGHGENGRRDATARC